MMADFQLVKALGEARGLDRCKTALFWTDASGCPCRFFSLFLWLPLGRTAAVIRGKKGLPLLHPTQLERILSTIDLGNAVTE